MKHKTQDEKLAQSLKRMNFSRILTEQNKNFGQIKTKVIRFTGVNIFLNQNLGKAPPGRIRSPGAARGHPPEKEDEFNEKQKYYTMEKQQFNTYQNSNYYKHFNSIIMKKQILFLSLFVLALFAGTSTAFGQLSQGITATQAMPALTCLSEPLHPTAGIPYTYTMDGSTGAETTKDWTWYVTKDPSFITAAGGLNTASKLTAPGDLLAVGANYGVATSAANSISITWSPEILQKTVYQGAASTTVFPSPTFVVGYATGTNCSDNLQVFEIDPKFNFTLDIANIDTTTTTLAWDAALAQCVDVVRSATYNSTSDQIDVNYGKDILYFEVAAANFVKDFTPTFTLLSGLTGTQTAVVSLHKSLAEAKAGTLVTAGATTNWTAASTSWATGIQFTAVDPNEVVAGVSLFVKVVISNNKEESLTANAFSLAVDARDNTNTGIWDMENEDCTYSAALDVADQVDFAVHTVNPRPTIIDATTPETIPNPDDVIIKTP